MEVHHHPQLTQVGRFVNFKANNYGYTTALNNALKIATELLILIDNKYQIEKQE